jgi:hypothetical protein
VSLLLAIKSLETTKSVLFQGEESLHVITSFTIRTSKLFQIGELSLRVMASLNTSKCDVACNEKF